MLSAQQLYEKNDGSIYLYYHRRKLTQFGGRALTIENCFYCFECIEKYCRLIMTFGEGLAPLDLRLCQIFCTTNNVTALCSETEQESYTDV